MRLASRALPHETPTDPELAFYQRVLSTLNDAKVDFLVGGAAALQHYTGICRDTKDLDLFVRQHDIEDTLNRLRSAGMRAELTFPHWLAKVWFEDKFVDLIFNSGNGVTPIDDDCFEHASPGSLLGHPVAFCPVEETIWSKAFVMERERYDGADVAHLLAARAKSIDWTRLLSRFGRNWRVLLAHLVLFQFSYPDLASHVPDEVMDELMNRVRAERHVRPRKRHCFGTLLSREQYLVDVAAGRSDGRLPPTGSMTPRAIRAWTKAIDDPKH